MGSLFFEDGSKEKLVKKAISSQALEAFLEFYAGHLLDSRAVDSKEACMSQIGRLVSDSMDRGECSVATMEHMKKFIQHYTLRTDGVKKKEEFNSLFSKIVYQIAKNPSKSLSPDTIQKLSQYKEACDTVHRLELELSAELRNPVREILGSYSDGHKSNINIDFGL